MHVRPKLQKRTDSFKTVADFKVRQERELPLRGLRENHAGENNTVYGVQQVGAKRMDKRWQSQEERQLPRLPQSTLSKSCLQHVQELS